LTEAHDMAVLAQQSYAPSPDIVVGDTEVHLTQLDHSKWAVTFTGTQSDFDDILTDMRVFPWYDKGMGWCHSGFLKTTRTVYEPVLKFLNDRHSMKVNLVGHSLGGARAHVMGAMLRHNGQYMAEDLTLYTFGCPRIFTDPDRAMLNMRSHRYVYGNDLIARVPAAHWWKHYAEPINLGDPGHKFIDHRIANYVEAIK